MRRASRPISSLQEVKLRKMINRFGDTRTIWIYGVLAVLVLVGGLQGAGKINIITDWARLLPGFNQTIPEGTSIVGVNLENPDDLMYFTGEKWRKIDIPKDKSADFVMGSYEFKPAGMKSSLEGFYFSTERKPKKLIFDINEWRYWEVTKLPNDLIRVNAFIKNYLIDSGEFGPNGIIVNEKFVVTRNDEFIIDSLNKVSGFRNSISNKNNQYIPLFVKIDYEKNEEKYLKIIEWRDSILEGNNCEKFISFSNLNEKKQKSYKSYTVRKVDEYLFVDLSKPVSEGKDEAYKDGCFEFDNYIDDRKIISSNVPITLFYTKYNGVFPDEDEKASFTLSQNGIIRMEWSYNKPSKEGYKTYFNHFENNDFYREFVNYLAKPNGYFDEHQVAFNYEREDQGVFINNADESIDMGFIKKGKELQEFNLEERNQFIYNILTEYYKHYTFEKEKPKVID